MAVGIDPTNQMKWSVRYLWKKLNIVDKYCIKSIAKNTPKYGGWNTKTFVQLKGNDTHCFIIVIVASGTTTARQMSSGIIMMIVIVFDVVIRTVYAGWCAQ